MSDIRTDLDFYQSQWDKALEAGVFKDAPKTMGNNSRVSWFGNINNHEDAGINDSDLDGWKDIDNMVSGNDQLLSEERVPEKGRVEKVAKVMGNTHNPVYPQSLGNDSDVVVDQNWGVGGEIIEKLAEMKLELDKLLSRFIAEETMGNKTDKIANQIDALKNQIDELSNSLNGSHMGESEGRLFKK